MADLKISQLTDGDPAQSADQIPVNRSGVNRRITVNSIRGYTDILWSDLLTNIAGSALIPFQGYHITDPPDGSSTIDEAWVQAKDVNEIFPEGMCLINAANITNRLASIRFQMAGGTGGKIQAVYDALGNVVEANTPSSGGTSATGRIDDWLNVFLVGNRNIKVWGAVITNGSSGTVTSGSVFMPDSGLDLSAGSNFTGYLGISAGCNVYNASNANGVFILGALTLDNGAILANGTVGQGKSLSMTAGETAIGFSTEGNTKLQTDGLNASGDIVTVDNATGTLYIVDGGTDITINMPTGLIDGQQMDIIFKVAQLGTTWGGAATDGNFFPTISPGGAPYKIHATWIAGETTWR